jgi:predicted alpha/beta hydrolase family esterase
MKNKFCVVFVHGAYGNSKENWFPWLKAQLESEGCNVTVPDFPTPEGQEPEQWLSILDQAVQEVTQYDETIETVIEYKNLIMVGHSIGSALILRKLELLQQSIRAAFLVSGFIGELNNPLFDTLNAPFFSDSFKWDLIKRNCSEFYGYNGDNDPYVPLEKGRELAEQLDFGERLKIIEKGGHINESAGFTEFQELLDDIRKVINESVS